MGLFWVNIMMELTSIHAVAVFAFYYVVTRKLFFLVICPYFSWIADMEASEPSETLQTGTFREVGFTKIILLLESKESVNGAARATSKRRTGPDPVALSI